MGKRFLFPELIFAALLFSACEKQPTTTAFEDTYGVWADDSCEMVRTSRFCILYERAGENLIATLTTISHIGDTVIFDDRGAIVFDSTQKKIIIKSKDLLRGEELLVDNDSAGIIALSNTVCLLEKKPDRLLLTVDNLAVEEYLPGENKLRLFRADGTRRELTLVEKLDVCRPYDMPETTADSIGICLQLWELGSKAVRHPEGYVTGVEINTNRHSYIFYFANMVYCRAARIRSDNNGTVFAQNIRMMFKPDEFTASMPPDNLAETRQEVIIVDSLFDPKVCIFAEDGIYWSLKAFDDSVITINGCGQDYVKKRKSREDPDLLEWFEYQPY
ncbi:MAG: hypothetical protein JXA92_03550 [candidate division Zixibacteria bacterium]|nr:hypothetical protein [candidate division Zixibacteria bacterium]